MLEILEGLIEPRTIITVLIAFLAFASVLGLAATLTERDPLKSRMKAVSKEREKLRVSQRGQIGTVEPRLRSGQQGGAAQQVVDVLHLRRIFEANSSRQLLRQAGLRSQHHLAIYLAARVVSPIALGLLTFFYMSTFFSESLPSLRIAAAAMAMVLGNYIPYLTVKNMVTRRQESIRKAWPDSLDLMLICVEAGMAVEPALQRVSGEIGTVSVALAEELALTVAELSYLQERRKAFENLSNRTGLPQVKSVVMSLIQSERYGTPLGTALRVLAQENREMRMSEIERKAAGLSPKLTVPMMLFFMPVIFFVILAPVVLNGFKQM
ncbi:type II secretion system F family protein [Aestuariivirga sp.]|uniref:type II secretion system F family protein n=1 Tax=Aestuariivirga sp. TaxID=2650926 RepID=UPI003BA8D2B7